MVILLFWFFFLRFESEELNGWMGVNKFWDIWLLWWQIADYKGSSSLCSLDSPWLQGQRSLSGTMQWQLAIHGLLSCKWKHRQYATHCKADS
jgi:hypothetical protein